MWNIFYCKEQVKKLLHEKLHFSKDGKQTKDFLYKNSLREISFKLYKLYNSNLAVLQQT